MADQTSDTDAAFDDVQRDDAVRANGGDADGPTVPSLAERLTPDRDRDDLDAAFEQFFDWVSARGIEPYEHQQEAVLELAGDAHVILATPTGSGKSLVAIGAIFLALWRGGRAAYTAPIKALVSEKFFDMIEIFGADRVGMLTGDSAVNSDADVICCTAEIVANQALRDGDRAGLDTVVMDEFHYYGDSERGWAWQVPLLLLADARFLLMSATLGDVSGLRADLARRTDRPVALVDDAERPVPLHFEYSLTPLHELAEELMHSRREPIYVVHFAQAAAIETAQGLVNAGLVGRERRDRIKEALGDFRFTTGFGKTLSRLVRAGIGVHHAGMLPRYRRLVEQLSQQGLLAVICGTDTLGVGINVPIHTVLFTGLTKFDGVRQRHLTAREFHQIAGRAGRAGFDTEGDVIAQAPEHEIENAKISKKYADDPKKRRKVMRKKAPAGMVSWGEPSFQKLIAAQPEPLRSQMRITHGILLNAIAFGGDVFARVRSLIFDSAEPLENKYALARRALQIYRTLRAAGVVEQKRFDDGRLVIRLADGVGEQVALDQPLSPFALAALELLDPESETYALDVVSIIEATLENPRVVLVAQQKKARGAAIAELKAEGVEYDERMEIIEQIEWPKPLDELLSAAFDQYLQSVPWAADEELRPKSVVRDMFERAMDFRDVIGFYDLQRSEGVVLRYLSDAFRALSHTVPESRKDEALTTIIEWLGVLVRQVDSSLIDEWEQLAHPDAEQLARDAEQSLRPGALPANPPRLTDNRRGFIVLVRNEMFRRVQLAAFWRVDDLAAADAEHGGLDAAGWQQALDRYREQYDAIGFDAKARSPRLLEIDETNPRVWTVRQRLEDPEENHDWQITAEVDLDASDEAGEAVVRTLAMHEV
ncbi:MULTISPECIES: DEAD/DEAH box helicase [unclassified Pseudoclavibacter]|uniref:DEAD/DEAH box helicase n=1 Tax=unclassified Pseudoclavibacter TaxID=2615177 RepID=UPI001301872B|nr:MULTISPECIES: DEAD/DEAH box helicase [unclassified Pseudoclavibacter]KAB1646519.1 DUF3516 domain-containing protein [Pseudoclavibacter sp. CFCC 14310]KAB1663323.1 DUF3516 domain-containing protein [Pseudoclavibacter sp. CFCC 13611]